MDLFVDVIWFCHREYIPRMKLKILFILVIFVNVNWIFQKFELVFNVCVINLFPTVVLLYNDVQGGGVHSHNTTPPHTHTK